MHLLNCSVESFPAPFMILPYVKVTLPQSCSYLPAWVAGDVPGDVEHLSLVNSPAVVPLAVLGHLLSGDFGRLRIFVQQVSAKRKHGKVWKSWMGRNRKVMKFRQKFLQLNNSACKFKEVGKLATHRIRHVPQRPDVRLSGWRCLRSCAFGVLAIAASVLPIDASVPRRNLL